MRAWTDSRNGIILSQGIEHTFEKPSFVRYRFEIPDRTLASASVLQFAYSHFSNWQFPKTAYHIEFHLCDRGVLELLTNTTPEQMSMFKQNAMMRYNIPANRIQFHRKAESAGNKNSRPFLVV